MNVVNSGRLTVVSKILVLSADKEGKRIHIGAMFPQSKVGSDPVAVRDIAQVVENLVYHHLLSFGHVILPCRSGYEGYTGSASHEQSIHEPLVLFGYLAAPCQRVSMVASSPWPPHTAPRADSRSPLPIES